MHQSVLPYQSYVVRFLKAQRQLKQQQQSLLTIIATAIEILELECGLGHVMRSHNVDS